MWILESCILLQITILHWSELSNINPIMWPLILNTGIGKHRCRGGRWTCKSRGCSSVRSSIFCWVCQFRNHWWLLCQMTSTFPRSWVTASSSMLCIFSFNRIMELACVQLNQCQFFCHYYLLFCFGLDGVIHLICAFIVDIEHFCAFVYSLSTVLAQIFFYLA